VLKDQKSVCQIAVPGNFQIDASMPGLAKAPGDKLEVMILSSPGQVKPINETVAKMMNVDKFLDNTDKRVLYADKPTKVRDGRTLTGWTLKVPRPGSGSCQASITVDPGGMEDMVKKIADTIGPAK
jgi:hypothetical protein